MPRSERKLALEMRANRRESKGGRGVGRTGGGREGQKEEEKGRERDRELARQRENKQRK